MAKTSTANRPNSKNPNNPAYHHNQRNRGNQLNPNNPEYKGGKGKGK
jgi:hypothetical protein